MNKTLAKWHKTITTPYLPVLGAVDPNAISGEMLKDISQSLKTGVRPQYDKSRRWSADHTERLIKIENRPVGVLIYTKKANQICLYAYGPLPSSNELAALLADEIICFVEPTSSYHQTNIYRYQFDNQLVQDADLAIITIADPQNAKHIDGIRQLDNGKEMAGFAYVADQLRSRGLGPVVIAVSNNEIIGALGPLDVAADANGISMLLPPYFGVVSSHRVTGVGYQLWEQAKILAVLLKANYLILQAEAGADSDYFYSRNGFKLLGQVYKVYLFE